MTAPEQPRPGGRPSLLTDERQQRIVDAVRAGNYLKVAAQWAGVGESTLLSWLARGRAAAALRDAHNPEHRYCPSCDLDREADAASVDEHNADPEVSDDGGAVSYAVLDRCPRCRTNAAPAPWALPDGEVTYLEFLEQVTRAETSAEVAAVTAWRSAFTDDWRAARDYLVRRRPERWAATTRIQMSTEEAERRIDGAVEEVVAAIGGVDHDGPDADLDRQLDDDLVELSDPLLDLDLDLDLDARPEGDPPT